MKKAINLIHLILVLASANAQFVTSGNDIYSSGTQKVGIGGISQGSKLHVISPNALDGIVVQNTNGRFVAIYTPSLSNGAMNPLSNNNDAGIIYGTGNASADFGFVIAPWSNNFSGLRMTGAGDIGVGTHSPITRFHVNSSSSNAVAAFSSATSGNSWIQVSNSVSQANFGIGSTGVTNGTAYLWSSSDKFAIGNDGNPTIVVNGMGNGSVGIGTASTHNYKLAVNGSAIFTKAVVKQYSIWPDYVFESTYKLPTLKEVEQFIKKYKHLPGVPSAKEMDANGLDLGENQAILLKKIEELTLYIIELKKENEQIMIRLNKLKTK